MWWREPGLVESTPFIEDDLLIAVVDDSPGVIRTRRVPGDEDDTLRSSEPGVPGRTASELRPDHRVDVQEVVPGVHGEGGTGSALLVDEGDTPAWLDRPSLKERPIGVGRDDIGLMRLLTNLDRVLKVAVVQDPVRVRRVHAAEAGRQTSRRDEGSEAESG